MHATTPPPAPEQPAPPRTFLEYLRCFGPGIVVVLTWLGAGDIVEVGVAGGNYGYALMWVIVVAIVMRFLFVSLIAKYQLCNQHGEGVLDGLARLHHAYPLLLAIAAVVMGHIYGAYMTVGIGETFVNLTGVGAKWQWALFWNLVALAIVFRPVYARVEWLFKFFLALLSVSLLGTALWVGPSPAGILEGTLAFKMPAQFGPFDPLLVAVGMIGAVGGSMMNLVYPYFLEAKGWRGPQYRRVQLYDFLLAVIVMIVLDLAIWTLGAEVLHPQGLTIEQLEDLPRMLSRVLRDAGQSAAAVHTARGLFYLGVFAAVFTSLIGHALGLACLGSHGLLRYKAGTHGLVGDYRRHPYYHLIAAWCLISPLVWTLPGMPGFVFLTLLANSAQVVLIPMLAGGLWWITASSRFIGKEYQNRWWENLVMLVLFTLALWGAWGAIDAVARTLTPAG